jgi:hypothetical protein
MPPSVILRVRRWGEDLVDDRVTVAPLAAVEGTQSLVGLASDLGQARLAELIAVGEQA